jgi:cytochrome P450
MDDDGLGTVLRGLLEPTAIADPYPVYERLRREQGTGLGPSRLVLRHAEAMAVLGDRSWSSDRVTTTLSSLSASQRNDLDPLERTLRGIVAFTDPPAHTRLRRLLISSFTPAVVKRQSEVIEVTTDRLLDVFTSGRRTTGDLYGEVLFPLPALVVGGILGIPEPAVPGFQSAAQHLVWWFGAGRPDAALARSTRAALVDARSLVAELLAERRAQPSDDLLSAMVAASALTEDEMLANAIFLMTAGHETAANALANSLVALLDHAGQLDEVRAQPVLANGVVDELLRYDSPVQWTARIATEDRDYNGLDLRTGQSVLVGLGAANRDPERFEEADRLRLDRPDNQPLSFGWGAHHCLGASLAREELRVVLPRLLHRLPGLTLVEPPTYQPTLDFRGPTSLQVTWR